MTSRKVQALLRDVGARLVRSKRHDVYALPNGRNVTLSQSPSDVNAERNQLREIRRLSGMSPPPPTTAPVRRKEKPGRARPEWTTPERKEPVTWNNWRSTLKRLTDRE